MALPLLGNLTIADLDGLMPIERQSFRQPWSRHMYLTDLQQNRLATYLVVRPAPVDAERLPPILAYGGLWLMVDEAHIATIASHPDYRGCGLGQYLLLGLIRAGVARGAVSSTLEVRVSNTPARQLYEKLGYAVAGLRRRYYQDGEDALIMTTPPLATDGMPARLAAAWEDAQQRLTRCFEAPQPSTSEAAA